MKDSWLYLGIQSRSFRWSLLYPNHEPKKNIHFEAFGPATVKICKKDSDKESTSNINIEFKKSGKTLSWNSKSGSLLDFAEENQIPIDSGCRAGNCGTCLTAVTNGDVELVAKPGSDPEAGSCLTCISIPKCNLTLDAWYCFGDSWFLIK